VSQTSNTVFKTYALNV